MFVKLNSFLHLQDIVTESSSFDLIAFLPLLQERILTRNPFARQFIVSWVSVNIFLLMLFFILKTSFVLYPDAYFIHLLWFVTLLWCDCIVVLFAIHLNTLRCLSEVDCLILLERVLVDSVTQITDIEQDVWEFWQGVKHLFLNTVLTSDFLSVAFSWYVGDNAGCCPRHRDADLFARNSWRSPDYSWWSESRNTPDVRNALYMFSLKPQQWPSVLFCLQCFDAVGWAAGRASGL